MTYRIGRCLRVVTVQGSGHDLLKESVREYSAIDTASRDKVSRPVARHSGIGAQYEKG
jgi:hypothetical protein